MVGAGRAFVGGADEVDLFKIADEAAVHRPAVTAISSP